MRARDDDEVRRIAALLRYDRTGHAWQGSTLRYCPYPEGAAPYGVCPHGHYDNDGRRATVLVLFPGETLVGAFVAYYRGITRR